MSRHHILPPLAYVPPPPKKIEKRRRRIDAADVDDLEAAAETAETHEASVASRTPPVIALPKPNLAEIEGSDRKPHNPASRLSEDMLRTMLQLQESE
jgi:hypothetical protein